MVTSGLNFYCFKNGKILILTVFQSTLKIRMILLEQLFFDKSFCQNNFGHPNRLKIHIRGCKLLIFYSNTSSLLRYEFLNDFDAQKSWPSRTILILCMLQLFCRFFRQKKILGIEFQECLQSLTFLLKIGIFFMTENMDGNFFTAALMINAD